MENKKSALLSKTLWSNLIMAVVGFVAVYIPEVKDYVSPEKLVIIFSFVNMILRLVTKDKLELGQ